MLAILTCAHHSAYKLSVPWNWAKILYAVKNSEDQITNNTVKFLNGKRVVEFEMVNAKICTEPL